jgi:16S rRNA (uracil1498-N3)-methyltransferase
MSRAPRVALEGLAAGPRDLPREAAHYLCSVHRLLPGDRFVAFDPVAAIECRARLVSADRKLVRCELEAPVPAQKRGALEVTLLQGIGKAEKPEEVLRAATALGARGVTFVAAERSVARPSAARAARLRSVAIEAARQSGRGDLPRIDGPVPLAEAVASLAPAEARRLRLDPLAEVPLAARLDTPAVLLIGPEGGWSDAELALAAGAGFEGVALGPLTLRTELAAAVALGCFAARLRGSTREQPHDE